MTQDSTPYGGRAFERVAGLADTQITLTDYWEGDRSPAAFILSGLDTRTSPNPRVNGDTPASSGAELLDRIDRATDGLCPCGAPPADGSAYCGDDCRPTHISRDTDTRTAGNYATPMRWRPDLVTAADDTDLDQSAFVSTKGVLTWYDGPHNARTYRRRSRPGTWHLRLDDGCRFVGADIADIEPVDGAGLAEVERRFRATWARLERELGNPRHLVGPNDGWTGVLAEAWREIEADIIPSRMGSAFRRTPPRREVDIRIDGDTTTIVAYAPGPTTGQVCTWLHDNGVDYTLIPIGQPITVTGQQITVGCYVRGEGGVRIRPDRCGPLVEERTLPLRVPLPEYLLRRACVRQPLFPNSASAQALAFRRTCPRCGYVGAPAEGVRPVMVDPLLFEREPETISPSSLLFREERCQRWRSRRMTRRKRLPPGSGVAFPGPTPSKTTTHGMKGANQ